MHRSKRFIVVALGLCVRASAAVADPPAASVAYRRVCRSYIPTSLSVARDGSFTWCFGRFRAHDGSYLGPLGPDESVQQPAGVAHMPDGHAVVIARTAAGVDLRWRSHDDDLREHPIAGLSHLRAATLSQAGDAALVIRSDGRREVVSLPHGTSLLSLPPVGAEVHVTASPAGDRVALGDGRTLAVWAIGAAGPRRIAWVPQRHRRIAFAHDGRTLLVERDDTMLVALRDGAPAAHSLAALSVTLPAGMRAGGAAPAWLPTVRGASRVTNAPSAEHGLVRTFTGLGVTAAIYATDAGELREFAGRTTGFARAVMDRFAPGGYDPSALRMTRGPGGERTVTFRRRLRVLADREEWLTVRAVERGGTLHRVEFVGPEAIDGRPCGACTEAVEAARRALLTTVFEVR